LSTKNIRKLKSLTPDGTECKADTSGLLKRACIIAGESRYVGKETDRKWEEGDDISGLQFAAAGYGRSLRVIASDEIKAKILEIGINKCARESVSSCQFHPEARSRKTGKTQFVCGILAVVGKA